MPNFPKHLEFLHFGEEQLYNESKVIITVSARLQLHVLMVEAAMDIFDIFRQIPNDDEDYKVIQVLGMRMFNIFASSLKLMMSGYYQVSALIMRDALETIFLIDYFSTHRTTVAQWRTATDKERKELFKPVKIREALDKRDGLTTGKRAEMYKTFSELAAHPTMKGIAMLRPKDMDARNGPFLDETALSPSLDEIGRLAVQAGQVISTFIPPDEPTGMHSRVHFNQVKQKWLKEFYGAG